MSLKSPEKTVADALVAEPLVAELLGDRIYPVLAPAAAALPLATWRRQAVNREMTLSGPGGMATVSLALELYAETYEGVRELADRCRRVLDGWNNSLSSWTSVRHVTLENEADGFVQLAGGELPPVYSVTQTYAILWQEN